MSEPPVPTLEMIARAVGVSPSTASRALHHHPAIAASTVARVEATAKAMGYRTNPIVSDLMRRIRGRGRTLHLGMIAFLTFHDSMSGWKKTLIYREFFEGAKQRTQDLGFDLESVWAAQPGVTPARLSAILEARGIRGVIVGPRPSPPNPDLIDWNRWPAACVGMPIEGRTLHIANSNRLRTMEHLLNVLHARGYRRIGLALRPNQAQQIDRGWQSALLYYQHSLPDDHRVPILDLELWHEHKFAEWMKAHRPDVVIGMAQCLPDWIRRTGARIPDDIGFVHLSLEFEPGHPAGVDQHPRLIGAAAVDLVVNHIMSNEQGLPSHHRSLMIEGSWIEGPTVRPPVVGPAGG